MLYLYHSSSIFSGLSSLTLKPSSTSALSVSEMQSSVSPSLASPYTITTSTTFASNIPHRSQLHPKKVSPFLSIAVPYKLASSRFLSKPCQVKSDGVEETASGESILLNEQTLEHQLQTAIQDENYAQAAKLRDSLRVLQENSKASVLAANARFYNSFRHGDLAAMQSLWSKGENVCVVHPGVSGISGYDLVMGSWEFVWADYEFPLGIEVKDVQVHVRGDVGYVTCTEMVKTKGSSWGRQFVTNVFEKIDGQWFICIHHASYV